MIINHTYRFIFLHVPKNAGTSVTSYLSQFTGWNDLELGGTHYGEQIQEIYGRRFRLHKHSTPQQVRRIVGEDLWRDYFKFAVVRHPLDRLVSAYHFYLQWQHPSVKEVLELASFAEFVRSDFLQRDRRNPTRPTGSQAAFLICPEKDCALDRLCRLESIAEDMSKVAGRLGLAEPALEVKNESKRGPYSDYYTPELVREVVDMYALDFEQLGYPIPDEASLAAQATSEILDPGNTEKA